MKYIIGTVIGFYVLVFWVFPIVYPLIFSWGGVAETHLHPIYMGMILLGGLIVTCTKIILDELKKMQDDNK
ncbi:hypothetical protein CSV79_15925 [Sporosarcina sp. P13]|uniref:hypothetical protein n=1 Tax=Sporosarcina sp. P13 TaxID=2048263 RepID=UPI000C162E5F|nr:hypothetical protein [Sporosarcina sp. P13]PIC62643.1 hypothetical protein CSV79_15925 [Sporosarcina sp. P13]